MRNGTDRSPRELPEQTPAPGLVRDNIYHIISYHAISYGGITSLHVPLQACDTRKFLARAFVSVPAGSPLPLRRAYHAMCCHVICACCIIWILCICTQNCKITRACILKINVTSCGARAAENGRENTIHESLSFPSLSSSRLFLQRLVVSPL